MRERRTRLSRPRGLKLLNLNGYVVLARHRASFASPHAVDYTIDSESDPRSKEATVDDSVAVESNKAQQTSTTHICKLLNLSQLQCDD